MIVVIFLQIDQVFTTIFSTLVSDGVHNAVASGHAASNCTRPLVPNNSNKISIASEASTKAIICRPIFRTWSYALPAS